MNEKDLQRQHIRFYQERAARQAAVREKIECLFQEYVSGKEETVLEKLLDELEALSSEWVLQQIKKYGFNSEDERKWIFNEIKIAVWEKLTGKKINEKPQRTVPEKTAIPLEEIKKFSEFGFRIYQYQTYKILDKMKTDRKRKAFSTDDTMGERNNTKRIDLMKSVDHVDPILEREKINMYKRLFYTYCYVVMNSKADAQRPLALYYAHILPHLLSISFKIKTIPDKKMSSAKWAFERMGDRTIEMLKEDSEYTMRSVIDKRLQWGTEFCSQLEEKIEIAGAEEILKNIVYTAVYSKTKIEDWADSMHKTAVRDYLKMIREDPELMLLIKEYIVNRDFLYFMVKGEMKNDAPDGR